MKVHYDEAVDALYIELSEESPEGAVELSDGINADTTSTGWIAGIEILGASSRIDLKTILSYSVDVDKSINALTSRKFEGIGGGIGEAEPDGSAGPLESEMSPNPDRVGGENPPAR